MAATAHRLARFGLPTVVAPLLDVGLFATLVAAGVRLASAHLASFGVAALVTYVLQLRAALAGRVDGFGAHGRLLAVALFALCLRGGALGLLTNVWGWPPQLAIVLAVAVTLAVTIPGYELALAPSGWRMGTAEQWPVLGVWIVAAAFLLRLVYSGQVELLPEETYYWNYGQHLDLGYLDHPPMVAWLIRLGTALFGNTEFGVRIGTLCTAGIASLFAYRLTRNLFGGRCALVSLVLMQALPFFFLAGLLTTPDVPLTAAWAGTLYFLERALFAGRARAWLAAGVCIGLGLISKYTIGMLVPATLLFVCLDPPSRRWLARWEPYTALAIAGVIFSPVIIWNARNDWASFAFQTSRRLAETPHFSLHKLILSAFVLLTPTGFVTLAAVFRGVSSGEQTPEHRKWRFMQVCVLVPLTVFLVFSVRHDVKIDWTGALWLAALPMLAAAIVGFGKAPAGLRSALLTAWTPTALIFLLLYGAGLHYLALGLPGVGYSKHMELVPVGWRELGRQIDALVDQVRSDGEAAPLVIGMDRYSTASELAFYSRDRAVSVATRSSEHLFDRAGLMYERWFPRSAQQGRTLVLVGWEPADLADAGISPYVERLDPIKEAVLQRDGVVIHHYYYRIAHGYHAIAGARP